MQPDLFKDVKFNHEYVDWSDPSVDALKITSILMGSQAHWKRPEFKGMKPMEIEREILFEAGIENWGRESVYGKPLYQHLLTLMRLLDPSTDIAPTLADATMFFCLGLTMGKKITNLIGCQNASKSASSVRIGFACLYIDPEYSAIYVANPFDNAADSTVWGEIQDVWESMCHHHPHPSGNPSFFPNAKNYADKRIEVIKGVSKAARIELRNTKHVGKYKGTKAKLDELNEIRGILLMLIDEVNEIDNLSFLTMLTNLTSQDNFHAITSQNFKDVEDMGGTLTEPSGLYGGPDTFDELDVERDTHWHSNISSVTLRFDGLKAANIMANRVIYQYLFKQKNLDHLKDNYGESSPEWYSQCRSFPIRGAEANSVLSRAKLSGSRHTDRIFSIDHIDDVVSFCDPSFGGKDKAVWGCAKYGRATVTDGAGLKEKIDVLLFTDHMKSIPLVKDAKYNDYWFDRMKQAGVDVSAFSLGSEVSYEDQIALRCLELNREEGIPAKNFGFDFSMRPDIVSSVNRMIGFDAEAFDYGQKPEGYFLQSIKKNTEDCCFNRADELAFLASDLFLCRQVRGGQFIETAIVQLNRTRYEIKNGIYKIENKADYKKRWQNISPDHRDVLMGISGMAHKRGFRSSEIRLGIDTVPDQSWERLRKSRKFKAPRGKRIYAN